MNDWIGAVIWPLASAGAAGALAHFWLGPWICRNDPPESEDDYWEEWR